MSSASARRSAAAGGTLIRQLLIEQALLVVTGGVLGALAGAAILTGLVSVAPREMPRLDEIRLDVVVLSWTTLFSCACAFVFGIVPAHQGVRRQWPGTRRPVGSRLDPLGTCTAPGLDAGGDRCRHGAALRRRTDGAHHGSARARRSRLRSTQPADGHVFADGPAVARRQEAGVLRRGGRTPSRGAGCGERRGHLFAADSGLELVERVHDRRHDQRAVDSGRGVSECGHGAGDRRLLRDAQDSARQRPVLQPIGHARLAARRHRQQQPRQEVLAE